MKHYDARGREGNETNAPINWLHLAATPTFVLMALRPGTAGAGSMDMLCPVAHGMFPLGGMTAMYLLMAIFHASPWLKLGARWWHRVDWSRSRH